MAFPHVVGWAHSKFGKAPEPTLIDLIAGVVPDALDHAGIGANDVDGIFVGVYNNGFSPQAFEGSLVGMAVPELAHIFVKCPRCKSPDFEVVKGRSIWIESVEGMKE